MAELAADLELAQRAVRAAGAVVMQYFGRDLEVQHKTPDQPLTAADLAANASLHTALLGARPADGWLSEETKDSADRLSRRRVWIVDPIDGTRSFIARHREFAISVGLAEDGAATIGIVYNPAADELFWAVRGAGAFIERGGGAAEPARVSQGALHERARILASRSELAAGEFDRFQDGWRIEGVGSTAYKLARVAEGRGELFLSRGPKSEWDVCAGALLVQEAGGRVTDLDGNELRYNGPDPYVHGVLATNGLLHDIMLQHVRELPPTSRLRARRSD